ncbi:bifunctional hydroxymethylpyrimidine kinase/phosphomethylpyrimidine kinase [Falsihalocynthiibacter sp. SS001]|uniref:bifunctional hydroxymethylpyrimidine kinase/phosphomethylpyrimidine kinase n=1 Tax=Falsihalocynthiibacter sp. SS001 TaxID=3349698 RepID=UPI0036D26C09
MAKIALTIAGSDSGGGAGIQADLKAFSARGVYGASVVTAVTAQNTKAVTAVQLISPNVISAQISAVLSDIKTDAIKIGMLANSEIIETVATALDGYNGPIVVDPVMIAKSGDALLEDHAIGTLCERLLPLADILSPNLPEAARILQTTPATSTQEMLEQGRALLELGPKAVLMKGGHASEDTCSDYLVTAHEHWVFTAPRLSTKNTHGTGCTLSAAIAAELAKGAALEKAVETAHRYLQGAIAAADTLGVGHGHGPVHHFHEYWSK